MIKQIVGYILIFGGILDSWKYVWQAQSIIKVKIAKGHSRKFLNAAILQDLTKIMYGAVIGDIFIALSSLLTLITMTYCWYIVYRFYPYRCRGLLGFRRPNLIIYIINSILPNKLRKKL